MGAFEKIKGQVVQEIREQLELDGNPQQDKLVHEIAEDFLWYIARKWGGCK